MAQTIQLKRSSLAGNIPTSSDLALGEIAINTADGAVYIKKGNNDIVAVTDNDILHIDTTNSRVGIGTTSPSAKLHIHNTATTSDGDGTATMTTSGQDSILLYGHGGTNGQTYGSITWLGGTRRRAMITAVAENADSDHIGLAFYTQGTDGAGDYAESMRISRGGNVGIGTTSPNSLLHVSHATAPTFRLSRTGTGQVWAQSIDSSGRFQLAEAASEGGTQNIRLQVDDTGEITFNNAYTFPTADGSANQVLQTDGSGNLSFADVSGGGGVTISNNANNRVLTGDGTNANAEANLTFDGSTLAVTGAITSTGSIKPYFLELEDINGSVDSLFRIYGWDNELQITKRNLSTGAHTGTLLALNYSDNSATFLGDISLTDNKKLKLGAGADLSLFHDGTHSYIDNNQGSLYISSSNTVQIENSSGNDMITAQSGGAVTLFYNAFSKLATKSDGVDITGELQSDSLDVDGAADISGNLVIGGNLTVNGSTVTNSATNTTIEDALIELGSGNTGANANDLGLILERGTTGDNVFIGWDESTDKVTFATTTATGASTGALTLTDANIQAGTITSGAITSTGNSVFRGSTSDNSADAITARDSSNVEILRVRNDGVILIPDNYLYVNNSAGAYFDGQVRARNGITDDTGQLSINSSTGDITFNSADLESVGAITAGGVLKVSMAQSAGSPILDLHNSTNGNGVKIRFTDIAAGTSQFGHIEYLHQDSKSYGSAASFTLGTSEATTTILADGKLMYAEGIYSKPGSGTGAGTRKDSNWDSAYTLTSAITSTAAELNVLDGYTGSVTELNYLDTLHATGVTSTEFDYLDGVTSNIQTQLNGKLSTSGTAPHANNLNATDDRDIAPEDLSYNDDLRIYFAEKGGLETGTVGSNYQDVLVLNSYSDHTGGDANALAFDKSEKKIYHYQADQAATNWGTAKTLAYTDDNITGTSAGLSGTPNITVGTISSGAITSTGAVNGTSLQTSGTERISSNGNINNIGSITASGVIAGSSYKVGSTFIVNSSRDLVNIGTISSGAITSTGAIEGTSFSDGTISGITFIDEDSFATNSATRVPTQQSIKAYVDAQVAGVVDSAPAALNTLNELAAALGDDASFSTTTSTALGNRLRVDTASQGLTGTQQANAITNLGITATKAELNVLDGITATTAELNYTDGVTSNIQTQLDAKAPTANPTFTGTVSSSTIHNTGVIYLGSTATANDQFASNNGTDIFIGTTAKGLRTYKDLHTNSGNHKYWHAGNDGASSGLDADLLDGQHGSYYLDNSNHTNNAGYTTNTGTVSSLSDLSITSTAAELNVLDGYTGSVTELNYLDTLHATGVTSTEFDYLDGVTSNIQTQLNAKVGTTGNETITGNKTFTGTTTAHYLTIDNNTTNRIRLYTEADTTNIADTFTDTTTDKSYIYFDVGDSSNDPGFIMHETSESETNEGVLHLVPSDDNATNDYVSIHGTNDADCIRLHTSGLIETGSSHQLTIKSGSGDVYINDNLTVSGDAELDGGAAVTGNITVTGTVDGRDVATDGTKLDGISSGADVTPSWVPSSDPSYLTGNQTITLSGDVSGSGTTSIAVTIADDSHNHVISNVDGLQTALDAKLPLSGGNVTGAINLTSTTSTSPAITFNTNSGTDAGADMAIRATGEGLDFFEPEDSNKIHMRIVDDTGVNAVFGLRTGTGDGTLRIDGSGNLSNIGTISSGAITATTINTGQGATEVYLMNQNVRSSDSPTFADLTVTGNLNITGDINSYNVTDLDVTDKTITLGAGGTASTNNGAGIIIDGAGASLKYDNDDAKWAMNRSLQFDDTPTTTNQNLGVFWTAFDKEGTTDFSDAAYIRHTANIQGLAGSVLEIKSNNDANDGIAFTTNASSYLKHNSSNILTAANAFGQLGITATAAELNVLDGYTGSVTELNYLDTLHATGVTSTEFDYLDGVTSNIQTQLDGKQASGSYVTLSGSQTITGAKTFSGGISLSNSNIGSVNNIAFADPGPNEGLSWSGGNIKIYESPDDLSTNTAGNLQVVYGSTRRFTVNNTGVDVNGILTAIGTSDGVVGRKGSFGPSQTSLHGSYDLYNNGTTYLNGAVTIGNQNLFVSERITHAGDSDTYFAFEDNTHRFFAAGEEMLKFNSSLLTINEAAGNNDFRVKGNTDNDLLYVDGSADSVGIGTASPAHKLEVNGSFAATTKSFDIKHPSKEGMRLKHGVVEGPEHSVYVRGKSKEKVILLPDYWVDLVHEDSITVQLTAIGGGQELYVEKIEDNKVYVNGENYFYYIQAERKDVERFEVEYGNSV